MAARRRLICRQRSALVTASPEPLLNAWENVTPAPVAGNLSNKDFGGAAANFGGQDVFKGSQLGRVYAGFCYQGIWKSDNFGKAGSWTKANTGTESANLDGGRPWSATFNPVSGRQLQMSGYGPQWGVYKSDDGGTNFTHVTVGGSTEDVYAYATNPYNPSHKLLTTHGTNEIFESTDDGDSWHLLNTAGHAGSAYPYFWDTGSAGTTATTILMVPQAFTGESLRLSTDGGVTWSTPTNGSSIGHTHGANQAAFLGDGSVRIGASGGIWSSPNPATGFTNVDSAQESNGVIITSKRLLGTYGYATQDPNNPRPRTQLLSGGGFADFPYDVGMTNGAKTMAYLRNGIYDVIIANCWLAGIWRYAEVGA